MRRTNGSTLALITVTSISAVLLAAHPAPALAQAISQLNTTPIGLDGGGVHLFDTALGNIKGVTGTGGWLDSSIGVANILFGILLSLTWVIACTRYYMQNQTIEGVGHMFGALFMKTAPMLVFMSLAPSFLGSLSTFATNLGTSIAPVTAIAGAPTLQNASGVSGPDEILNTGGLLVGSLIGAAAHPFGANGWQMVGKAIMGDPALGLNIQTLVLTLFTGAVIMIAFIVFAVEYMLCLLQCYLAVSIGAVNLGWIACDATKNFGEAYISMCWTMVMRIVLTIACISLVMNLVVPDIQNLLSKGVTPENQVMVQYKMMAEAAIAALLAWKIPAYGATLMSGQAAVTSGAIGGAMGLIKRSAGAGYDQAKPTLAKINAWANRRNA